MQGGWHTFKGREDATKLSSLSINFFQCTGFIIQNIFLLSLEERETGKFM